MYNMLDGMRKMLFCCYGNEKSRIQSEVCNDDECTEISRKCYNQDKQNEESNNYVEYSISNLNVDHLISSPIKKDIKPILKKQNSPKKKQKNSPSFVLARNRSYRKNSSFNLNNINCNSKFTQDAVSKSLFNNTLMPKKVTSNDKIQRKPTGKIQEIQLTETIAHKNKEIEQLKSLIVDLITSNASK